MKVLKSMESSSLWGIWEIELEGSSKGNPFTEVSIEAEFSYKNRKVYAPGFYNGNGVYKVRFMPDTLGEWQYKIIVGGAEKSLEGSFKCDEISEYNHGPVRVKDKFHFAYEDGKKYLPIGTTCYAWIHQPKDLRKKTLETLEQSPFNKLRMCIFPKWYDYNKNEPDVFPYERNKDKSFDYERFNPEFFELLEDSILELGRLGIEADLILFHPYDNWGSSIWAEKLIIYI